MVRSSWSPGNAAMLEDRAGEFSIPRRWPLDRSSSFSARDNMSPLASSRLHRDEMWFAGDKINFSSNNSGGVIGGISSGQDIVVRFAVKPTSSILVPR